MPYLGRQPGVGVRNRYIYTATASQTTFSGADDNGATLAYDDAAYVDVYLNGVLLIPVTDYAATTKTSVVLTSGAAASDLLEILAYEISSIADTVSKANGGTFDGAITVNGNFSADGGTIKLDGNYPVGTQNVALGDTALDSITTGKWNVALGHAALTTATNSNQQTAIGRLALTTSNGSDNTAVGFNAANANTSGTSNTAIGAQSLNSNTTGINNTAVGYQAGYSFTTASYSTVLGYQAAQNATAGGTVAIGHSSAKNNTGAGITAVGSNALVTNTTGTSSTAVGTNSLNDNTTGSYNVALGRDALYSNTTASNNTALGYQAGSTLTTGANNVLLGALNDGGVSGSNNISIGYASGIADTGSNNIIIGYACAPSSQSVSNEMIISTSNVAGKGANTGFITPNGGGVYQGNNSSTWSQTSDVRLKKNITDSIIGLAEINQLQIRNFEYRTEDEITELDPSNVIDKAGVQVGVIAQEIQTVLPNCVREESTGVLSVDPDNLTWHLIKAVQELSAKNDALEARLAALENA